MRIKDILAEQVVRRGDLLSRRGDTYYGWRDAEDWPRHSKTCQVYPFPDTLREFEQEMFLGTFQDDIQLYGLDVKVNCHCGKLKGRWFRWEAKAIDIVRVVLTITEGKN